MVPTLRPIARLVDLVDPGRQQILNLSVDEARGRLLDDDPAAVLGIHGSFALAARDVERCAWRAASTGRCATSWPRRRDGPCWSSPSASTRSARCLEAEGYGGQFHPTYTRMVPAHHVTRVGWSAAPTRTPSTGASSIRRAACCPPTGDEIGRALRGRALRRGPRLDRALARARADRRAASPAASTAARSCSALYRALLDSGQSAARLKAFTLAVDGGGEDLAQARAFLRRLELELLGETIEVPADGDRPAAPRSR